MSRSRLLVPAAVLLIAAIALVVSWPGDPPGPAGGGGPDSGPQPAPATGVEAARGDAPDRPANERREVDPTDRGRMFRVTGRVLADARMPIAGAEIVAVRGRSGDRPGMMSSLASLSRPGRTPRKEDLAKRPLPKA